jgi:hypothetical protein
MNDDRRPKLRAGKELSNDRQFLDPFQRSACIALAMARLQARSTEQWCLGTADIEWLCVWARTRKDKGSGGYR